MRAAGMRVFIGAGLVLLAAACGDEEGRGATPKALSPEMIASLGQCGGTGDLSQTDVRFVRDVQPVLDLNCVACHQSGAAMDGLVLETGLSHSALVGKSRKDGGMALIKPGDPSGSYMFRKINGSHKDVGGKGERMPLGGQLDEASVRTICQWIVMGASED